MSRPRVALFPFPLILMLTTVYYWNSNRPKELKPRKTFSNVMNRTRTVSFRRINQLTGHTHRVHINQPRNTDVGDHGDDDESDENAHADPPVPLIKTARNYREHSYNDNRFSQIELKNRSKRKLRQQVVKIDTTGNADESRVWSTEDEIPLASLPHNHANPTSGETNTDMDNNTSHYCPVENTEVNKLSMNNL